MSVEQKLEDMQKSLEELKNRNAALEKQINDLKEAKCK